MVKIRNFALAAPYVAVAHNAVLDIVTKQIGATREVTVRDLFPVDLGEATNTHNWVHTYTAANTFENLYSTTVPNSKAFIVYGFSITTPTGPLTTAVQILVGSSTVRLIGLQELADGGDAGATVYLFPDDQIIAQENQTITIQGYATSAAADNVVVLGFVAEPKGETIFKDTKRIVKI